jgi:formylglycine-generating enzyme required for sulfatase activity
MIFKKSIRPITFFILSVFICFTLTYENSFGQDESPLIKAQDSYRTKNFIEAIRVLEIFIKNIQNNQTENKRLAEAYYLLARINYDSGEDAKTDDFLKQALEANDQIGKRETNPDFKTRLDQVKKEWLEEKAAENEIVPEKTSGIEKVEETQPEAQEKEKPIQQLKKKKKFPWLLAILGIGAVAALIVLLGKKKNNTQPIPDATFANGVLTVKGVRYELASIPAGAFQMGSNSSDAWSDEQPVHTVRISKGFWMGKTEMTQGLWQAVMASNPSYFKKGDNYPVENISWNDCQSFIQKLNQMLGGNAFRLPNEAEWEYACRAGTTGDRYGDLNSIAWYRENSGNTTHPVSQKQSNSWGLYDTLGNVYEWCQDWYGSYIGSYQTDPTGPSSGLYRVRRSDGWNGEVKRMRSAARTVGGPNDRFNDLGFRLAASSSGI